MHPLLIPISEQDHAKGNLESKTSLVEYGDYQCLVCKLSLPIIEQLFKELNNNLLFVFRHFPLKESHPFAMEAAKAAEAAGMQNKFWQMHALLYSKQFLFNHELWKEMAKELHLDIEKFQRDFNSPLIEEKIQKEFSAGIPSGVNGTPSFFINGIRFDGDPTYRHLLEALELTL